MAKEFETKKYAIFKPTSSGKKEYVYEINRSSIYTTEDMHQAMFVDDVDTALCISKYLTRRTGGDPVYGVIAMVTTCEVIEEEE